eukprot:9450048-Karenia_brevis.AAC.1
MDDGLVSRLGYPAVDGGGAGGCDGCQARRLLDPMVDVEAMEVEVEGGFGCCVQQGRGDIWPSCP